LDSAVETLTVVVVGHVDHGKSTLIGRLLYDTKSLPDNLLQEIQAISEELGQEMQFAYLLDALEEERAKNITIDTTQRFLNTGKRECVIIDAPGHKEFLRNMVTGASAAHAAVLIVDAKQGIQEQTRRHGFLLSLLGLSQVVVVVNKMDLVDYRQSVFQRISEEIRGFFANLDIEPHAIIPIAAAHGDNIARRSPNLSWYDGPTVLAALDSLSLPPSYLQKPMRFSVQDIFLNDGKSIAVGILHAGRITKGQEVTVLPSTKRRRIVSIEVWQEDRVEAVAGECVGVVLSAGEPLQRGQILAADRLPAVVEKYEADIFWMAPDPLKVGQTILLQCSTQETPCELVRIERKIDSSSLEAIPDDDQNLRETEVATVTLRTETPVVLEPFQVLEELGRFVLVRNGHTVAGGIVSKLE
jgi:sulfate adenylyltransferase large subunit